MEHKKDLAKIALAALILASAHPVNGQAVDSREVEGQGTFLVAGCPSHCPASKKNKIIADNTSDDKNSYTIRNNSSQSDTTSPGYVEDRQTSSPSEYGGMTHVNREYNTTTDDDHRAAVTTSTSSATLTEAQLIGVLSPQGRTIYLSLDPEGKALAIQLASQDSYRDKNLAIKEAQRRMNERRGLMNR